MARSQLQSVFCQIMTPTHDGCVHAHTCVYTVRQLHRLKKTGWNNRLAYAWNQIDKCNFLDLGLGWKSCALADNTQLLELSPENTHLILSLQSSDTFDGFPRQNQTQAPGIWNSTVIPVPATFPCHASCVTADGGWLTWTETCGCYSSALWPWWVPSLWRLPILLPIK